jgi:hypothetical protein
MRHEVLTREAQFAVTVTFELMSEFAGPFAVMLQEPAAAGLKPNGTETDPEGKEIAPPGAAVVQVPSMKTSPFVAVTVSDCALGAGCGLSSPG